MDYIPNIYRTLSMYQTLSTFMYKLIQASQLSLYKGGNSGMRKLMSASKLTQLQMREVILLQSSLSPGAKSPLPTPQLPPTVSCTACHQTQDAPEASGVAHLGCILGCTNWTKHLSGHWHLRALSTGRKAGLTNKILVIIAANNICPRALPMVTLSIFETTLGGRDF